MHKNDSKMNLVVTSPNEILFQGEASKVVVPTIDGLIGILPHHQATICLLGHGEMTVTVDGTDVLVRKVESGIVEIRPDNKVIVLLKEHNQE